MILDREVGVVAGDDRGVGVLIGLGREGADVAAIDGAASQRVGDGGATAEVEDVVGQRDVVEDHIAGVHHHEAEVDRRAHLASGPGGLSASCQVLLPSTETSFSTSMAGSGRREVVGVIRIADGGVGVDAGGCGPIRVHAVGGGVYNRGLVETGVGVAWGQGVGDGRTAGQRVLGVGHADVAERHIAHIGHDQAIVHRVADAALRAGGDVGVVPGGLTIHRDILFDVDRGLRGARCNWRHRYR